MGEIEKAKSSDLQSIPHRLLAFSLSTAAQRWKEKENAAVDEKIEWMLAYKRVANIPIFS